MSPATNASIEQFLSDATDGAVTFTPLGPKAAALSAAHLPSFPWAGFDTWVTCGASATRTSMWRGLPVGNELVLTLESESAGAVDLVADMCNVTLEDRKLAVTGERRLSVRANGVWAPGFPPHLVFVKPLVSLFEGRKKFGDRYVSFYSTVPIDEAELRAYDRDPAAFISSLKAEHAFRYPRH